MKKRIKSPIRITDYKLVDKRIKLKRIEKHKQHLKNVEILELKGYKVVNNDVSNDELTFKTIKHKQVNDVLRQFYGHIIERQNHIVYNPL